MTKSVEERLASIETTLEIIPALDAKVDQLLIDQAREDGERKAIRRLAGYVSLIVSLSIGALGFMFNHFV